MHIPRVDISLLISQINLSTEFNPITVLCDVSNIETPTLFFAYHKCLARIWEALKWSIFILLFIFHFLSFVVGLFDKNGVAALCLS